MSLTSLGSNYALRTAADSVPAAGGEPPSGAGSAAPAPAAGAAAPAVVPQNYLDALARWIPTETITLYTALVALSNTDLTSNQSLFVLVVCAVINVVYVWTVAVHRAVTTLQSGTSWLSQFPRHVPVWEIVLSVTAFVFWVSAVPGSWPTHWSSWNQWYGGVAIVLAAVAIPFLATQLNISPLADQQAKPS